MLDEFFDPAAELDKCKNLRKQTAIFTSSLIGELFESCLCIVSRFYEALTRNNAKIVPWQPW